MVESSTLARAGVTYFERLGLAQRFALDAQEAERNYLARSREAHPDFHQLDSSAQQRASLEESAALNEAYATLREPFRRAEYLLQLEGGPSAAEHKEMGPAFLEEMLELRMEIEELRESAGRDSSGAAAMERQLVERRNKLIDDLAHSFAEVESLAGDTSGRKGRLVEIRQTLNSAKYIQGLLRDLRAD
jgi:molecular chaperone HscB